MVVFSFIEKIPDGPLSPGRPAIPGGPCFPLVPIRIYYVMKCFLKYVEFELPSGPEGPAGPNAPFIK